MPKIILSMPMKDIAPILKGIERYKMRVDRNPWVDNSYEGKLFWEGYDAAKCEDAISIQQEWDKEIDIFNGHDIIEENI